MAERMAMLRSWVSGDYSVSELAAEYGVSRKTTCKWIERYEAGGWRALEDQSRAPRHHPNAVWCADCQGWFRTGDGTKRTPLTISDGHSRYLPRTHRRPTCVSSRRPLMSSDASTTRSDRTKRSANAHRRKSANRPSAIIPHACPSNAGILTAGKSAGCNPPARSNGKVRTSRSAKPWLDKKSGWSPSGKEPGISISNILCRATTMNANAN